MAGIGVELIGDWKIAKKVLEAAPADLDQAVTMSIRQEAQSIAAIMKKKFRDLKPENSPLTILMKGSSKPGVNKGDLKNSITVIDTDQGAFIGIPRKVHMTKQSGGRSSTGRLETFASLADIIENGRTIVQYMTEKQRKFLHATLGQKVSKIPAKNISEGPPIVVIHIPPRPFIRPTFEEAKEGITDRFTRRVIRNLKVVGK